MGFQTEADFQPLHWTDEQLEAFWSFHAREAPSHAYFSAALGQYVADYLARSVPLARGGRFLDFGCGPGHFLEHLATRNRGQLALFGLDFSESSAASARERLASTAGFSDAICVGQLPAPWPAASFDYISSLEVVEHLDDEKLDGFLAEAHRLLKPGGMLFITTPNDENLAAARVVCPQCRHYFHRWQHVRSWNVESLSDHVALYGFAPVRVEATSFGPAAKRFVRRLLKRNAETNLVGLFRKQA
jgi:2-polyprenyl-3-methyl-5-hydroxy-6-metoxy-1,4-benzoquinol methylase